MLGCSDPNKAEKETNVNVDIIKIVGFKSIFAKTAYTLNLYQWRIVPIIS